MLAYRMYVFDTSALESHRCDPMQFGISCLAIQAHSLKQEDPANARWSDWKPKLKKNCTSVTVQENQCLNNFSFLWNYAYLKFWDTQLQIFGRLMLFFMFSFKCLHSIMAAR